MYGGILMKKILILTVLVCVITAFAFADNFTVQSVTGRVERVSGNQRVAVTVGETLNSNIVIHTSVGASLVLRDANGATITVPAARNGTVAELTRASSGVRIGGNVARTDTDTVSRTTAQAGTASARASDAAGDDDIAAE